MKLKSKLLIAGIALSLMLFVSFSSSAINAVVRGNLPSILSESSGLDFSGTNDYWSHDDAGGSNKIYRVNSSGSLKQTITIAGATNDDWEDITHNATRTNMFIGDFGNNYFDRRNLRIYKIPYPTSATGTSVTASAINFSYPDQKKFPAPWKNFDAEAFFYMNGKLYLFTKADGNATAYTKMYSLPDVPGTYVATFIDSFKVNGRITGAAISADSKSAVLISNTQIHLFRNFTNNNIFNGQYYKITISGGWTQKEGVTFSTNTLLYLSEEGVPGQNHLYSVDLSAYIIAPRLSNPDAPVENAVASKVSVFPNPANNFLTIRSEENYSHVEIKILSMAGQIVQKMGMENPEKNIRIETEALPAGIYVVQIIKDYKNEESVIVSLMH